MNAFTKDDLKSFQAESLPIKKQHSLAKIAEWFSYWKNAVYVAFSGGKDSSVLADLCAFWCSITGATLYLVFVNTGLEYPEIQKHVKVFAEWLRHKYGIEVMLEILRPKMRFDEVIKKHGYPVISKEVSVDIEYARKGRQWALYKFQGKNSDGTDSKRKASNIRYAPIIDMDFKISNKCCSVMKKAPAKKYEKETGRKAIIATLAEESSMRENAWLKNGCNAFNAKRATCQPMSFWREQDVLQYIKQEQIPIASVYGDIEYAEAPDQMRIEDYGLTECGTDKLKTTGCDRTGCIFCAFGCHLEKSPSRFERLKETHPRQYEYCIGGGEYAWIGRVKTSNDEWRDIPWLYDDGTPMTAEDIERFVEECKSNENYDFRKVWQPNKQGLGMGHVFEELNKIYGKEFIKYE